MASVLVHPRTRWGALFLVLCLCGLVFALSAQPAAAAPTCTTDCYVDVALGNDANDGTAPGAGNALQTIQAAINQVNSAGTVHVAAGTYAQEVAVNKSVTVDGDGPATTIIDPTTFVNISAGGVTIQDLTIQNGGTHGATITGAAALANITFDNVHLKNNPSRGLEIGLTGILTNLQVLNSLFDGNTTGIRIFSGGRVEGLTIDNTTFQNHPNTSSGIGFYQANDGNNGYVKDLHMDNNTFTGNGFAGIYVEEVVNAWLGTSTFSGNARGIMIFDWYDSTPVVSDNITIHDNTFTDNTAASIMVIGGNENGLGGDVDIHGNTFNQDVAALAANWAVVDVRLSNGAFSHGQVDIDNNTITFSGTYDAATATYGVKIRGGVDTVNVTDNTIDGGGVGANGGTPPTAGVYVATNVAAFYGATKPASVVTVTGNLINNFPLGVVVYDEVAAAYGGLPAGATLDVNRNDLSANSAYGFQSGPATESNGTCNWWGATSGPSGEGPGAGTAVSTDVDFHPWLYSNDLNGDCYIGGTITIVKEAAGGEAVDFTFDVSWSDDNVVLNGGGSYVTTPPLPEGNYSIYEIDLPPGWTPQSATCEGTDNVTGDPSSLNIFDNFDWVCTFTNVYTPPSTCPATGYGSTWTDILGIGMGNPKKHKVTAKLAIPNWDDVSLLYGQLVAKNVGNANYVRFMYPGANNYVQVNVVTSPPAHTAGNFWYGTYLDPAVNIRGRWFLQANGTKNHIPRAFVLYPTYTDPVNTYVNVWETFDAADSEVDWNVAGGWVPLRELVVPIAPNAAPTTFHVELALTDNDKDAREVWITVTAGNVTQTVKPSKPNKGDQLNILEFDLAGVPAGTDEIVIKVYSPTLATDGVTGDSAMVVGMAAHYQCLTVTD